MPPTTGPCRGVQRAGTVGHVSYEHVISEIVKVVEAVGAGIMVVGGFGSFVVFAWQVRHPGTAHGSYHRLRRNLGCSILLGLEVLIVADIVRTIIVDPTIESVAVLGIIIVIRILLSFALEVEIDGIWPPLAASQQPERQSTARELLADERKMAAGMAQL